MKNFEKEQTKEAAQELRRGKGIKSTVEEKRKRLERRDEEIEVDKRVEE